MKKVLILFIGLLAVALTTPQQMAMAFETSAFSIETPFQLEASELELIDLDVPAWRMQIPIQLDCSALDLGFEIGTISGDDEGAEDPIVKEDSEGIALSDFIRLYWLELLLALMAFLKVLTNLTPSEKDNKMFGWLDTLFNTFVPNYKKGGGKF